jgi:hypothetical protein
MALSARRGCDARREVRKQRILRVLNLEDTSLERLAPSRLRDREAFSCIHQNLWAFHSVPQQAAAASLEDLHFDQVHHADLDGNACAGRVMGLLPGLCNVRLRPYIGDRDLASRSEFLGRKGAVGAAVPGNSGRVHAFP